MNESLIVLHSHSLFTVWLEDLEEVTIFYNTQFLWITQRSASIWTDTRFVGLTGFNWEACPEADWHIHTVCFSGHSSTALVRSSFIMFVPPLSPDRYTCGLGTLLSPSCFVWLVASLGRNVCVLLCRLMWLECVCTERVTLFCRLAWDREVLTGLNSLMCVWTEIMCVNASHQFNGFSSELPLVPLIGLHNVGLQRVCLCLHTFRDGFHQQLLSWLHLRHEFLHQLLVLLDCTLKSNTEMYFLYYYICL